MTTVDDDAAHLRDAPGAGRVGVIDPALDPAHAEHVRVLLAHGRRVQAIRLYRDLTGACLADATAAIDALT